MLDIRIMAMRFGSSGIASKLLDAGCEPTKLYIIEDCGLKLAEILPTLRPSDPYRRSEEVLRNKTPSQAAGEGDLVTLETYWLREEDFSKVDGQGNNQQVMKKQFQNHGRAILRIFQKTVQKTYLQ